MYGGGKSTFVAPVRKMDLARAMAVIGSHPDSDGHDFEVFFLIFFWKFFREFFSKILFFWKFFEF